MHPLGRAESSRPVRTRGRIVAVGHFRQIPKGQIERESEFGTESYRFFPATLVLGVLLGFRVFVQWLLLLLLRLRSDPAGAEAPPLQMFFGLLLFLPMELDPLPLPIG